MRLDDEPFVIFKGNDEHEEAVGQSITDHSRAFLLFQRIQVVDHDRTRLETGLCGDESFLALAFTFKLAAYSTSSSLHISFRNAGVYQSIHLFPKAPPSSRRISGNAGLGFEFIEMLYCKGAKGYIASRTRSKTEAAIEVIGSISAPTPGEVQFIHLNLSDLNTVRGSTGDFAAQEQAPP